jgi:hypothetical protein
MKKRLGRPLFYFFGLFIYLAFSGCAAHFFTVPSAEALRNPPPPLSEKWETTFADPNFSYEDLKTGGMALLAILTPGAPEGLRQNAAFEIFQGLRARFPDVRVVPRSVVVEKIGAGDKMKELNLFLRTYEERRSVDPAPLKQWGEIEGVRYLFIGQVRFIDKHTETQTIHQGERSIAGKVSVFSSGPIQMPGEVRKQISLSGELWDSHCGKAVWMGKSETEVVEMGDTERVRMEDLFIAAGRNLTAALGEAVKVKSGAGRSSGC